MTTLWPSVEPTDVEVFATTSNTVMAARTPGNGLWHGGFIRDGAIQALRVPAFTWAEFSDWLAAEVNLSEISRFDAVGDYQSIVEVILGAFDKKGKPLLRPEQRVYFIRAGIDGPIKIGIASNVATRLRGLQTASPFPLHLIASIDGGAEMERTLHERFAGQRLHGEWFAPTHDLLAYIAEVAA